MKRYVKSSISLADDDIKVLVSTKVLKGIEDYGLQTALRRILFDKNNRINWQTAWEDIVEQMPELKKETRQ